MFRISARVRTAVAGFVPIREPGFRPPVDPATPAFDHRGNPIRCGPPRRHRVLAPGAGDAFRGVQGVGPSHRRGCTLRGGPTRARAHSAGGIWRPNVRRLRSRVRDIGLQNVAISLGKPHDPRLPTGSVDIAILVHMYHETIWSPRLSLTHASALSFGPTSEHGTPPSLLRCELAEGLG
jgi:hypothetical protein